MHFNVTEHPTERWAAQQLIEAFPFDTAPRYLIRDRDTKYSDYFKRRIQGLGIEDDPTRAPHSRWQNPFVERLIGTIFRSTATHPIPKAVGNVVSLPEVGPTSRMLNRRPADANLHEEPSDGIFGKDKFTQLKSAQAQCPLRETCPALVRMMESLG